MLLQTFVQLNILLFAAPALAGWVGVTPCHPLLVQAAQAICRPVVQEREPSAALSQAALPAVMARPLWNEEPPPAPVISAALPDASGVTRTDPFPLAARAP